MKFWGISAVVSLLLASGVAATRVDAYPGNYGPFEPGHEPADFPLQECQPLEVTAKSPKSMSGSYAVNRSAPVRLQLGMTTNTGCFVTITDAAGKRLSSQQPLTDIEDLTHAQVYTADLNKDGKPDYVAYVWYGGCGLASENYLLVLGLSSAKGYKIITQDAMSPSIQDFIDLRRDGSCQLISTSFVYGEKGKDGKPHNYWAYELYEIKDTGVRKANQLLPGFPKLVWYSFRDNHKETDQLTKEQKAKLLGQ